MTVEIAGMAAKAVETGKKVVEVAKKAEKVASTVEKPIKTVEKITADKAGNWGTDIVKSGVQKGVCEIKSGLAEKLKDYLGKDDVDSGSADNTETKGQTFDTKETQTSSETSEEKGNLKDKLNKYLDSADSLADAQDDSQDDGANQVEEPSVDGVDDKLSQDGIDNR